VTVKKAKPAKPVKEAAKLSDNDRINWSVATVDVKPLRGKRRIPPQPLTAEQLRNKPIRAKTPVMRVAAAKLYDSKLDLHGLTEAGAHKLLVEFMRGILVHNDKRLLIITGKGEKAGSLAGVLRAQVPRWLDVEPFATAIRSVEVAPPNLGGTGAWLVTMKARRK